MKHVFGLALAALALVLVPGTAQAQDRTVIRVGNLLTDAASQPSGPATIVVQGGKIVEVRRGSDMGTVSDAQVIDLSDKTVMPGLIDLHVHLTGDPGGDYWKSATEPAEWGVVVGAKMPASPPRPDSPRFAKPALRNIPPFRYAAARQRA